MTDRHTRALDRELKKGEVERLILSLLYARPRQGDDVSKLIDRRSGGELMFDIDPRDPFIYRLEERGRNQGTWAEKAGEVRRRFYKATPRPPRPRPAAPDVGDVRRGRRPRDRGRACMTGLSPRVTAGTLNRDTQG